MRHKQPLMNRKQQRLPGPRRLYMGGLLPFTALSLSKDKGSFSAMFSPEHHTANVKNIGTGWG